MGFKHSGKLHKWTTYNKTVEQQLAIDDSHIRWSLIGPDGVIEIRAERATGGLLHAPLRAEMQKRVEETMLARIEVKHFDKNGQLVFSSIGDCAAMEVFGDLERLLNIR